MRWFAVAARMSVIGIDFGTQYCVIAQAKRGGVETLNNEASKRTNEALVSFLGENRFLAAAAVSHVNSNYKNTVTMIKRFVGKSWSDPAVQNDLAFVANRGAFREVGKDEIGIVVHYQDEEMVLSPVAAWTTNTSATCRGASGSSSLKMR